MWNTLKFETHLESRLAAELHGHQGGHLYSGYTAARDKLLAGVYEEIKGVQPDLSDHGPEHISDVLNNAHYLLSDNYKLHNLSAMELYLLAMAILFHDVGNLFGREDHNRKIGDVFDWARATDAAVRREKTLVLLVVRAHTGEASDGTKDTLKEVSETDHVYHEGVRLREIAAILRLADELAEGPHRTSGYRLARDLVPAEAKIFHEYASVTHIRPDRGTGRILVTYEIPVNVSVDNTPPAAIAEMRRFLDFIYGRAVKLDQERRYARFYSSVLSPFRATLIALNFHWHGMVLPTDLAPIQLDDKVVPGDPTRSIPEIDVRYETGSLVSDLLQLARTMGS